MTKLPLMPAKLSLTLVTLPLMLATLSLTTLTGCDPSDRRNIRSEHNDRVYQAAMADYKAGRIEAAIKGFGAAVRANPENAEARFQLACLLHDAKKDMLGAFCAYREYLILRPDGDKAALARRRMAVCERELAAILAAKHKLLDGRSASGATGSSSGVAQSAKARIAQLENELAEAKRKLAAVTDERARLVAVIKGGNVESTVAAKPSIMDVKSLLDDDEGESPPAVADEVAALRREESAEAVLGTPLLTARTAEDTVARKTAAVAEKKSVAKPQTRPEKYEVQEGDSLYKIALRFYGSIHAWRKIRDANKALISTDGRVQAGDTIRLP